MSQVFDEIRASLEALDAVDERSRAAFDEATGRYFDDEVSPTVGAMVWRGRVARLRIDDAVCKLPHKEAEALINHIIIGAYNAWHQDFTRRLAQAH